MGVETLVFWDRVYLEGELIEDTRDYVAQHKQTGDVWYFGEHVDNYENGVLVDHEGAWLSGAAGDYCDGCGGQVGCMDDVFLMKY